jgi:hypothetical protein
MQARQNPLGKKHYRRRKRVTSRDRRRHSHPAQILSSREPEKKEKRDLRPRAFGAEIA